MTNHSTIKAEAPPKFSGTISFKELAIAYYPHVSPVTASRNLRRDIDEYQQLRDELTNNGWQRRKRTLFPIHVEIIERYLGKAI